MDTQIAYSTDDKGNVTKVTTITESVDFSDIDSQVADLENAISGFSNAKTEAQAQADQRKAEMDGKISEYQGKIDALVTQKQTILVAVPSLAPVAEPPILAPVDAMTPPVDAIVTP